ncbi:PREDICTED: organic cation transporter protein-like [Papilio xuthus]|uniref:Organic cation transporter protein-like n=1 Tax=Papilio xuthus TaxID=66420 RepID=A0AAJ7EE64_PAPXU|nr:PREDICTED: organic cation transporter protein-like [Papilio xuthus]
MVSMVHVNYIFVAEDIPHRCRVPECDGTNASAEIPPWWPKNVDSKCFRPVVDVNSFGKSNNTCSNATFEETLEECHEWIYENHNSIVAALNLGCQSWKSTLVGSVHNAGMIASVMISGWIADKIGRKPTIIVCSIGAAVGVFKIFIQNYYAYLAVEFLESMLASGLYTVNVVLLIEVGGESTRVLAGVIFSYAVYIGEMLFAFTAMGLQYWKTLILIVYTPMFLFVFYVFILKESTRWQLLRGKTEEAKETLKVIAKVNKINVTDKEINEISDADLRSRFNVVVQKEKETMKDIINSKEIMIRLTVASFCFFSSSFIYYGMAVHSILLPGNKYTNFVLTSLSSFPGDFIAYYTFKKFGRKITLQCGYIFSAGFLLAQAFSPDDIMWLKVALFLAGKVGVVVCFTGIYTYSLELFPTSVRGSLIGWGNTAARIGSMLAPLTPLLSAEITFLPSLLFASTAIISALLLTFTPETRKLPLFDTIAQVDNYREKIITAL